MTLAELYLHYDRHGRARRWLTENAGSVALGSDLAFVRRGPINATVSARVFGVGGMPYATALKHPESASPVLFAWEVLRAEAA